MATATGCAALAAAATILHGPTTIAAQRPSSSPVADAGALRALAHAYYEWPDASYPVGASDQGRHTWDDRLTDHSPAAVLARRRHVTDLLARVRATQGCPSQTTSPTRSATSIPTACSSKGGH